MLMDTTYSRCYKCVHYSRNNKDLKYKKRFKIFRFKYWRFLLYRLNFWEEGFCKITLIVDDGQHVNLKTKGYENCLIKDLQDEVIDAKSFVGNIPDDPDKIADVIDQIEKKQKNDKTTISPSS